MRWDQERQQVKGAPGTGGWGAAAEAGWAEGTIHTANGVESSGRRVSGSRRKLLRAQEGRMASTWGTSGPPEMVSSLASPPPPSFWVRPNSSFSVYTVKIQCGGKADCSATWGSAPIRLPAPARVGATGMTRARMRPEVDGRGRPGRRHLDQRGGRGIPEGRQRCPRLGEPPGSPTRAGYGLASRPRQPKDPRALGGCPTLPRDGHMRALQWGQRGPVLPAWMGGPGGGRGMSQQRAAAAGDQVPAGPPAPGLL